MTVEHIPADPNHDENATICRKLLKWGGGPTLWSDGERHQSTPAFETWADAGLIIDALNARLVAVELSVARWADGEVRAGVHLLPYVHDSSIPLVQLHGLDSGPIAIRAAALKYIEGNL